MEDKINTIRSALERAQLGLKWYRDAHPEDDSGADDEMDAEIGEALAALTQLEAMAGEQEPVGRVDSVSTPFGDKLKPVLEKPVPVGTKLFAAPVARQQEPAAEAEPLRLAGLTLIGLAEHDQYCAVFGLDDEGKHRNCNCGLAGAIATITQAGKTAAPVAQQPRQINALSIDSPTTFGGCPFCGRRACVAGQCQHEPVAQQLEDFEEGQWWLKELDAMVKDGTPDQKRAVAVVRNLMATAKAPQQVEDEPYMYISRNQFEKNHAEPEGASGRYLPVRKTPAGRFTCPLYLKPQQVERVEEDIAWGIAWGTHGDRTCVSIIKKHPDGITEVVASEYEPAANVARKTPQQAEAVPPGYVLVPVEPTPEMLEAGKTGHYEAECKVGEPGAWGPHGFASRKVRVAHVYRAMIAAAQGAKT